MNTQEGQQSDLEGGLRFKAGIPIILLIIMVLITNIISRSILSPLLIQVEKSFGIRHGPAAQLFLYISVGYSIAMLLSGFVSSKLTHRGSILLCSMVMSVGLAVMAVSPSMEVMRVGVFIMGSGSGLYPPSGIATITALIHERDWQKALSLHEIGPHFGMVLAPLYANFMLTSSSWRGTLGLLSGIVLAVGLLFFLLIRAGNFKGEAPTFKALRPL